MFGCLISYRQFSFVRFEGKKTMNLILICVYTVQHHSCLNKCHFVLIYNCMLFVSFFLRFELTIYTHKTAGVRTIALEKLFCK